MSTSKHHFAHHFKSAEHEFESVKLGVWLFLCTEILTFGGLFVAYAIFHNLYPETFAEGASHLNWRLGAINTIVLLLSSYTVATAIYSAQTNNQARLVKNLIITIACGAIFMCIKYFEYTHKIHEGILPGAFFKHHAENWNLGLYFSLYFCMTGLHGLHVLIGMGLLTWLLIRSLRGEFNEHYYTPVEGVGLFWHLVDLIWIYLFPLLYLIG